MAIPSRSDLRDSSSQNLEHFVLPDATGLIPISADSAEIALQRKRKISVSIGKFLRYAGSNINKKNYIAMRVQYSVGSNKHVLVTLRLLELLGKTILGDIHGSGCDRGV